MPAARLGVGLVAPVLAAAAMLGVRATRAMRPIPQLYRQSSAPGSCSALGAWIKTQVERSAGPASP